jgi:hypothetical protein
VRKALAMTVVALALAGCVNGQGAFVDSKSSHFRPGVTTRAEAISELGPPSSVYDRADGSRTLTWARNGGLFNEGETRGVSVQFGPDDKMIRLIEDAPPPK